MSSAYHPQSDGQTERVNQCLETYLRCFVHSCPRRLMKWLALAEYWYNTSTHSALGKSPFEILFGRSPSHFGISDVSASPVPDVSTMLDERTTMLASIRQHLLRAQQRMKSQADKKRTDRSFQVGDFVYLRLQPYVQSRWHTFSPEALLQVLRPVQGVGMHRIGGVQARASSVFVGPPGVPCLPLEACVRPCSGRLRPST